MRVGVSVFCEVCGYQKCPRGRSASPFVHLCDSDCSGYNSSPLVGDLWPGETEKEFGYPVSINGTKTIENGVQS